jgi:hypothetical protein
MERFFELSGVTVITLCSMGLALLIEVGLLKLIFQCLAHVKVEAVEDCRTAVVGTQWVGRTKSTAFRDMSCKPSAVSGK